MANEQIRVRFGFSRPAALIDEFDAWTRLAEDVGCEAFGFGEAQTLFDDLYIVLAMTAERTQRSILGPTVTVPVTRHPTVAANAISTVQKMSDGRAYFAIGPGDFALREVGIRPTGLAYMAQYATTVRDLCAGKTVEWEGKEVSLRSATMPVPLWLAGDGPRGLELAGRMADGVIIGNGSRPELVRWALTHVEIGAHEAGRTLDDLDIWFLARIHVAPSREQGVEDYSNYMARYPKMRYGKSMHNKGMEIDEDLGRRLRAYIDEWDASTAYDPNSRAGAELMAKHGIRDWLADHFVVTGPEEEIVERLVDIVRAGARNILVPQMLPGRIMQTTPEIGHVFEALNDHLASLQPSSV
jgi:5,10-methylenetetrahydromethanopterin reductase